MKTATRRAVDTLNTNKEDAGVCAPDKPYNRFQILWLRLLGLMLARQYV